MCIFVYVRADAQMMTSIHRFERLRSGGGMYQLMMDGRVGLVSARLKNFEVEM